MPLRNPTTRHGPAFSAATFPGRRTTIDGSRRCKRISAASGPCSQAEDVQKFVHNDLGFGRSPEGWSNQLDDEVLVNLNYEYRHKLWKGLARYETSRWGRDFSVGTQVGVGNLITYASAWFEYRFGWDIPRGFTKFADPPAFGIALDPVYFDPNRLAPVQRSWRPYFNVVARVRSVQRFVATEDGTTENGGFYSAAVSTPGDKQLILGVHIAKIPLAFHLTYYRYLDDDDNHRSVSPASLDWVNFSFEQRFSVRRASKLAMNARAAGPGGASLRNTTFIGITMLRGVSATRIFTSVPASRSACTMCSGM